MFLKVHQKCLQITENEMNIILAPIYYIIFSYLFNFRPE